MGSGKTTCAKLLSQKLNLRAIELDDLIIESSGLESIAKIFDEKGELFFRKLERECFKKVLENTQQTISLGGGTILQEGIKQECKKGDLVIYLDVPFEICNKRVSEEQITKGTKTRPLFQDEESALQLFNARKEKYELAADILINLNEEPPDEAIEIIIKKLMRLENLSTISNN